MREYRLPSLGADMEGAKLVEWKVSAGQAVRRGDILAVVETVKGAIEIEVFEDAVVDRLLVEPDRYVHVGEPMALLRDAGEQPSPPGAAAAGAAVPRAAPEAAVPAPAVAPAVTAPPPTVAPAPGARLRVSPAARNAAMALHVDLATVRGSGPQGAINVADVEAAARSAPPPAAPPPAAPPPAAAPPTGAPATMREAIAAAMTRSKREIPHYYLQAHVDLGVAMQWLETENRSRGVEDRLLPAALLLRAVARAIRVVPELNGHWVGGAFRPSEHVHLGVAISLRGGGLVAPAIHDADTLDAGQMTRALLDLVTRARRGGLRGSELSDPTITVTNLGELGVDSVLGVIYPPQVAIVGFGRIRLAPAVADGQVVARPSVEVSLSADHRVSDGHRGGLFLSAVDRILQEVPA